jgi:L-iditol 2-dehydrogenase
MTANLPETMDAAVYRGPDDVRLETVPVPAVGPGELLLQVSACGVCGTDLKKIHHGLQRPPRIYGHETVGRIAALGSGVTGWQTDQRVAVYHHMPCGQCHYCRRGVPAQCEVYKRTGVTAGFEPAGGGFARYVRVMDWIVASGGLQRIPDGVSDVAATFVEPVNTCLKGIERAAVQPGDVAHVVGAGSIGLLLMQLARVHGAQTVISDVLPGRLAVAERLGATVACPPEDVPAAVSSLTDGRGADAVLLAVPRSELVEPSLDLVRAGGRVVLFAHTRLGDPFTADAGAVCTLDKAVIGSYSSDARLNARAAELVFDRLIEVEPLVTHTFALADIDQALTQAGTPADDSLKVVVIHDA